MKTYSIKTKYYILAFFLFSNCGKQAYHHIEVDNPLLQPNNYFQEYEDLNSPKFSHLIEKYNLDTVFHGETDEFKRILLLRHWIKSIIAIDDYGDPYPGEGNVEVILDSALKGYGYHCGHFMIVQNAIQNAYGYLTRTLGAGPGVKGGPDGHHGINEIWLNQYNKWFLSDAKYDHHFEKDGIPLSALEIRDEYLKNKAANIICVKGPQRARLAVDPETGSNWAQSALTYVWIEWHGYNNIFTAWPDYTELLIMYEDDYFKNNTWIWDGKPHWAYAKPEFMKLVQDRNQIYWTPNTIASNVIINGDHAMIALTSETPNLKDYEMLEFPSVSWSRTDSNFVFDLRKKKYALIFRAENLAGVTGPEHRIVIERH